MPPAGRSAPTTANRNPDTSTPQGVDKNIGTPPCIVSVALAGAANAASVVIDNTAARPLHSHFLC